MFIIIDSSNTSLGEDKDDSQEILSLEDIPIISFHAIFGATYPQTLHMMGKLRNNSIIVLTDSGSTCNFIDQDAVIEFRLLVNQSK